jgi:dihydrolipoamide dehydrogenase
LPGAAEPGFSLWRRRAGRAIETGSVSFDERRRSRLMGRNPGALQVDGEAGTGRVLSAEMLGPTVEHIGHQLARLAQRSGAVQQLLGRPLYRPLVDEGLRTALRQ